MWGHHDVRLTDELHLRIELPSAIAGWRSSELGSNRTASRATSVIRCHVPWLSPTAFPCRGRKERHSRMMGITTRLPQPEDCPKLGESTLIASAEGGVTCAQQCADLV